MLKKMCCQSRSLCPGSFGLALGVTLFLCVFIGSIWAMVYGGGIMMPMMAARHGITVLTWGTVVAMSLLAFLKGFVLGFVFALIYDLVRKCCRSSVCCGKAAEQCKCTSDEEKKS